MLDLHLPFVRSDPAAFESRLEKRSEFRKQPVGHSKQSDFIKCVEQKVRRTRPWRLILSCISLLALTLKVVASDQSISSLLILSVNVYPVLAEQDPVVMLERRGM